jgi:signal transduction histidine kinase
MSPLDILKLVGFATGAALHLYLCWLLIARRGISRAERAILSLCFTVGIWHLGNFAAAIYQLLSISGLLWWLKAANELAYVALALLPPLLIHAHLRFWEFADARAPRRFFPLLIWASYAPLVLLPWVVYELWRDPYEPPVDRLSSLLIPFILWFAVIEWECAGIDFRLARVVRAARERRFFEMLGPVMAAMGVTLVVTYVFGARTWGAVGRYLEAAAMLSSILPTAILAYYIYRYRYFELVIRQSLVYAAFAVIVLVIYLYGIRRLGILIEERFHLNASAVEALLILGLMFLAGPLRRITEAYIRRLFVREVGLYRELVAQVGAAAASYGELERFIEFAERRIAESLELGQVKLIPAASAQGEAKEICFVAEERQWTQVEEGARLKKLEALACYALWRESRVVGLLVVRGAPAELTAEKREVLSVLAGHLAVAIENCQLLEEKVRLERELAERERLASLGQMAATVAHEIKNPLSSIKSIVQVMREDTSVSREYSRDLDLIKGEIDRLSRSVSQLLSFSRPAVVASASARLSELVETVLSLARTESDERGVQLATRLTADPLLDGEAVAALKEVLVNLVLNAVQATGPGGHIHLESDMTPDGQLRITVIDDGAGIPASMQEKVFEPFFTTRQRGTGLGLAIVARRVRELDGTMTLKSPADDGRGTRFDVILKVRSPESGVRSPIDEALLCNPNLGLQTQDSKFQTPDSGLRTPDS